MNQGIFGTSRARGGSPARPMASRAEALAGTDAGLVMSPLTASLSRRGGGRAWFWELFHDFAMGGAATANAEIGSDGCIWFNQSTGTGSGMSNAVFPFRGSDFGVRQLAGTMGIYTGTTTTGRGGFDSTSGITTHRYDTGVTFIEALINIPTLANVTDDYVFRWGHMFGTGLVGNEVGFEYNRSNSVNWVGVSSNSSYTRYDTGIPVTAGNWIRLRATWDSQANVLFQVNDYQPVGGTALMRSDGSGRLGGHIIKTAGTTSVGVAFDYVYYRHDFTNERTYT